MILGIDVSTYLEELEHGAVYLDEGKPIDPLDAFVANGVDHMRIRIWNDPKGQWGEPYLAGSCDLDHYIRLGRLAKSKGYRLMMDLHYSDFWADPGKQMIPKAWQAYDLPTMANAVYEFTKDCLLRAAAADVSPAYIQVGNEITNGILWPMGKLEQPDGSRGNYETFIQLVGAGCRACRRFGKEQMIVELGYGFTTEAYSLDGASQRLVIDADRAYVPGFTESYPVTPEGQAAFIRSILHRARQEGISGVFYWEPLWLPGEGICWASEAGQAYIHEEGKSTTNEWANHCLFDYDGNKLPGVEAFA